MNDLLIGGFNTAAPESFFDISGNIHPAESLTSTRVPKFAAYPFDGFSPTLVPEKCSCPANFGN